MAGGEQGDGASAPGAIVPPPVIFVAAFALGYLVDLAAPLRSLPVAVNALGGVLIVLSGALVLWALRTMRGAGTTVNAYRPARALVAAGPYRFSRNPMYVSLALLHAGLALALDLAWALVLLPAALAVLHYGVIVREEAHLEPAFGQDYRDYKARVHRWL